MNGRDRNLCKALQEGGGRERYQVPSSLPSYSGLSLLLHRSEGGGGASLGPGGKRRGGRLNLIRLGGTEKGEGGERGEENLKILLQ